METGSNEIFFPYFQRDKRREKRVKNYGTTLGDQKAWGKTIIDLLDNEN